MVNISEIKIGQVWQWEFGSSSPNEKWVITSVIKDIVKAVGPIIDGVCSPLNEAFISISYSKNWRLIRDI